MKKNYNWGILGAGAIARKFASDLMLLPNAKLYAIGSKSPERAKEFAAEFSIPKAYGSYEEFAADPEIDIIYIASRHIGHYPDTLLCLEQGKAVLCEKPVAMNRQQYEAMVELADRKKLFFMEALWTRFIPSFLKMKEIVESGRIGEPKLIESDFSFKPPYDEKGRLFNPLLGGGALLDVGIYPIFIALQMGGSFTRFQAMAKFDRTGVDNQCIITGEHEQGPLSMLSCSVIHSGKVESLIHGSRGMLRVNKWWHTPTSLDLFPDEGEPEHFHFEEPGFGYQYEAQEVMNCLDKGLIESPRFGREDSRQLITMLDRIREMTGIAYPPEIERL